MWKTACWVQTHGENQVALQEWNYDAIQRPCVMRKGLR